MGNVQYPDWSQMASVLVNGEWRPMDGARSM